MKFWYVALYPGISCEINMFFLYERSGLLVGGVLLVAMITWNGFRWLRNTVHRTAACDGSRCFMVYWAVCGIWFAPQAECDSVESIKELGVVGSTENFT